MAALERESRHRRRNRNLQKIVLGTVASVGLLSVGLFAPNALMALKLLGITPRKREQEYLNRVRTRLIDQGLLTYEGKFIRLTPKGEAGLRRLTLENVASQESRRWDKRWRVLIFDIPERRKKVRDQIRRTLRAIGFMRLQDSVWLYPYDCEDLVVLLKADFKMGKELLYMIVESLENDLPYRRHFKLRG